MPLAWFISLNLTTIGWETVWETACLSSWLLRGFSHTVASCPTPHCCPQCPAGGGSESLLVEFISQVLMVSRLSHLCGAVTCPALTLPCCEALLGVWASLTNLDTYVAALFTVAYTNDKGGILSPLTLVFLVS